MVETIYVKRTRRRFPKKEYEIRKLTSDRRKLQKKIIKSSPEENEEIRKKMKKIDFSIDYYNKHDFFIGQKDNELLFKGYNYEPFGISYKRVAIHYSHPFSAIRFNKDEKKDAWTLVNAVAFFPRCPSYIDQGSKISNYLDELYYGISYNEFSVVNNLKFDNHDILHIEQINHPILLDYYNTALKQPEPLARCVFLFRMVEYGQNFLNPRGFSIPDYIEFVYQDSLQHRYIPLDNVAQFDDEPNSNQIILWKKKARRYEQKWLRAGKSLGDTIYKTGRCGIVHGRGTPNPIIFHDYSKDYFLIEKINVFLELIGRYLIEKENHHFRKYVKLKNRRKEFIRSRNPTIYKI